MAKPLGLWFRMSAYFDVDEAIWLVDPLAELVFVRMIAVSKRTNSYGFVSIRWLDQVTHRIDRHGYDEEMRKGLVSQLVERGLLVEVEGGWQIVSFDDWQESAEQAAELGQRKSIKARESINARWHREGKHDGNPRNDCPLCRTESNGTTVIRPYIRIDTKTETETELETESINTVGNTNREPVDNFSQGEAEAVEPKPAPTPKPDPLPQTSERIKPGTSELIAEICAERPWSQHSAIGLAVDAARRVGHHPDSIRSVADRLKSTGDLIAALNRMVDEPPNPALAADGLAQMRSLPERGSPPPANLRAALIGRAVAEVAS